MALYGVGLDTTVKRLNTELKLAISQRGGVNIRSLQRVFKSLDLNGNNKIDIKEFEIALAHFGFFPKKVDLQALLNFYDLDRDGFINFEEFVKGLREPMNKRRTDLVNKIFNQFAKGPGGEYALLSDLMSSINVSRNMDYLQGKKTKEKLLEEFAMNFESPEGKITRDDLLHYYEDVSLSVPSDEYFVALIQNSWGIVEEDVNDVNPETVKQIVKTLRQRLVQKTSGNHDEFIMRKLFNDFDLNKSGNLCLEELYAMMIKLEIPIQKKYLGAVFNKFDVNNNGVIEFEEFLNYIINNPYP